jgi:hypothetical protein
MRTPDHAREDMSERYWDAQLETLPAERRRLLRDHRLRWQVRRCWEGSPFYRARLESAGLDPDTFGGLADLGRIPILRADDLPLGDCTDEPSRAWVVAPDDWWQAHEQTEDGLVRVLTDGDVVQRAHLTARAHWAAGIRTDRSLAAMSEAPTGESPVGIPDVLPGVAYACDGGGVHWSDDQFLVECVDPATADPLDSGEPGVVILTDLAREGSPLIRFWTGLEADLVAEPCACGRTSIRSTVIRPVAAP